MNLANYHALRAAGRISHPRTREVNSLPSATDPTQDCPVSAFQFAPDGSVVNCAKNNLRFSNVPLDQMTRIESRHRDAFDVLGEQQELAKRASSGLKSPNVKKSVKQSN